MKRLTSLHGNLNFALACLLALLYFFSHKLSIPAAGMFAGRLHPLLLHLPIGLVVGVIIMHFSSHYDEFSRQKRMAPLLQWTATTGLLSAIAGLILAAEPDVYQQNEIDLHKHSGTAFAMLFYAFASYYPQITGWFRNALLALSSFLLILAGHWGASITHGEGFLFPEKESGPSFTSSKSNKVNSVYDVAILPILKEKCLSCHNAEKTKGNLNMADTLLFLKGGKNGAAFVWGKPEESLMLTRIHLDLNHEEHMPPKERKQLSEQEIALLTAWIQESNGFGQLLGSLKPDSKLHSLVKPLFDNQSAQQKAYTFSSLGQEEVVALNTPYRTARPIYKGSPALTVSYFLASEYNTARLQELTSASNQITELSLAGMPVKDEDLSVIAALPNLEKLNLSGTLVTSKGIETLSTLKHLESLSIAATGADNSIAPIWQKLTSLRTVFIGQTRVYETELALWRKKHPSIQFSAGISIPEKIKLSVPVMKNEQTIIRKGEKIILQHFIKGAKILYTTDGTMPDTIKGTEYKGPFAVSGSSDIRAVAVKDGWLASDVASFSVFEKGNPPARCSLLTKASTQYPGQLEKTFTDGEKAPATNLRDQNWIAFRDEPFHGLFSYDSPESIRKISFSYALQIPQYVFPPTQVRVLAGNDASSLKLLTTQKLPPFQPATKEQIETQVIHIPLPGEAYKYYRIEAANLPVIPSWHPGRGEKGWLFIDEIFFYE